MQNIKALLSSSTFDGSGVKSFTSNEAAKHLIAKVGSADKEEVILKGGHVSLVAGANAVKRLWPKLESWLSKRSI